MTTIKMRFLIVVALLLVFAALPVAARAAIVSGSVSTADGSVIGGGDWATGVTLDWSVADAGSAYLYTYVFDAPEPGLSHFDLQLSGNFTDENILQISNAYEIGTFTTGPSTPGWPIGESLYGIKFDGIEGDAPWTLTLLSDRAPMEGDFYAKGGNDSFAYNSGFGSLDGANILVPDTESYPVPEPGTLLLLGGGLAAVAGLGRMRSRK